MKFSTQEEYGLRCLLQVARQKKGRAITIPEISEAEGLSQAYVGKLMRLLRQHHFVISERGQAGGYLLARPANEIKVGEILATLGGRLYEPDFCKRFTGTEKFCTHNIDCSVRSLWQAVQSAMDSILNKTTLVDLIGNETSKKKPSQKIVSDL